MANVNRRSFLRRSAGAATGAALVTAPVSMLLADEAAAQVESSDPAPADTVVAFVRNAERGEVTVLSGTSEVTYRDRALVKRLLRAAR